MQKETDLFLQEVQEENPLEQNLFPQEETLEEKGEGGDDLEEDGKKPNRRERRLEKALQEERASSAFMAGRLQTITEAQKFSQESGGGEYLKNIERIYGQDSPEAIAATELLKSAFKAVKEESTQDALRIFREEQNKFQQEVRQEEGELDSFIEDIEDEYNVTLTPAQKTGYFTLLSQMSPKDASGNIVAYADAFAVWDVFKDKIAKKPVENKAKELSNRSMVQSGASKESKIQDDSTTRFLKENGII